MGKTITYAACSTNKMEETRRYHDLLPQPSSYEPAKPPVSLRTFTHFPKLPVELSVLIVHFSFQNAVAEVYPSRSLRGDHTDHTWGAKRSEIMRKDSHRSLLQVNRLFRTEIILPRQQSGMWTISSFPASLSSEVSRTSRQLVLFQS